MKTFLRLLPLVLPLMLAPAVQSQTGTVNFTASNISFGGSALPAGQLCAVPVDANNHPFQNGALGGPGGALTNEPACVAVTAGAIPTLPLPDTALTTPTNLCLRVTITDAAGAVKYMNPCVQPASSGQSWCTTTSGVTTCNFDHYTPAIAPMSMAGSAIDSTARSEAVTAQSTANSALPANGATSTGSGTANVVTFPGSVAARSVNNVFSANNLLASDCGAQIDSVLSGLGTTPAEVDLTTACASSPVINTAVSPYPNQNLTIRQPGTYTLNQSINFAPPSGSAPGVPVQWTFDGGSATLVQNFNGYVFKAQGTLSSTCTPALTADLLPGALTASVTSTACFPTTGNFWVVLSDASDTHGYCSGWSPQSNGSCNAQMREAYISGGVLDFLTAVSGTYAAASGGMVTVVTPVSVHLKNINFTSTGYTGAPIYLIYFVDSTIDNVTVTGGAGGVGIDTEGLFGALGNGLGVSGSGVKDEDGLKATGTSQTPITLAMVENFHIHDVVYRNVGEGIALENYTSHGDVGPFICDGVGDSCANTHGNFTHAIVFHDFISHGCAENSGTANCQGIVVGNGTSAPPDYDVQVINGHVSGYRAYGVEIDGNPAYMPNASPAPPVANTQLRNIIVSNVIIDNPIAGTFSGNTVAGFNASYATDVTANDVLVRDVACGQNGFQIIGVLHPHFANSGVVQEQSCSSGTTFGWYIDAGGATTAVQNGEFTNLWSWGTDSYPFYVVSGGNTAGVGYIDHVRFHGLKGANAAGSSTFIWPASANMTNSPRTQIDDGTNDYASAALTNVASINGQAPFNPAQANTFGNSTTLAPIAIAGDATRGRCIAMGNSGNGSGWLCTRYSYGDVCLVTNAYEDQENADHWAQDYAAQPSYISCVGKTGGNYSAAAVAGRSAGTWSAFWGSTTYSLSTTGIVTETGLSTAGVVTNTSGGVHGTIPKAGSGAGVVTGPTSGVTANDGVCYADASGTTKDCGTSVPAQHAGLIAGSQQWGLSAITGTGSEVSWYSWTLPAGTVAAGGSAHSGFTISASFTIAGSGCASNCTYYVTLGGTNLAAITTNTTGTLNVTIEVQNNSGSQSGQTERVLEFIGTSVIAATYNTSSVDLTSAEAITLAQNTPSTITVTPRLAWVSLW